MHLRTTLYSAILKITCRYLGQAHQSKRIIHLLWIMLSYSEIMPHTILLIQPGKPETRTYSDYDSINECMEDVCHIFERYLKRINPNTDSIIYDVSHLFDFIDQLKDFTCLVYQRDSNTYVPYNKDWIKEKVYIMLRLQARGYFFS